MQIIRILKGLYWYFRYNQRIVIPCTKAGWNTLWAVAASWQDGFPMPMEYGSFCLISLQELMNEKTMNALDEVLEYQRARTEQYLAAFSVFPTGPWIKIDRHADDVGYRAIGWKQEFEWRPTC